LFIPAVEVYAERLSHYVQFELLELPAGRSGDERSNKVREGSALLAKVGPRDRLVSLDERGRMFNSLDFSRYLSRAQNDSRNLFFAVGGDAGLAPSVLAAAHLVLSLSLLTMPHRLARLVLVEQLYRAFTLLRGEPYPK
jgi:23S rRNA (pseudouridine1915-N3)-methyltransferase